MNDDQRRNVDAAFEGIVRTLIRAWSELHLLQGIHLGARTHPKVTETFDSFFGTLWDSVMFALIGSIGILVDRTSNTSSLPSLLKTLKRYKALDQHGNDVAREIEGYLREDGGPVTKLQRWRHNVVAHRTADGLKDEFFAENKMTLAEMEMVLSQLDAHFNRLSQGVQAIYHDTKSTFYNVKIEGQSVFATIDDQLRADAEALERL